jgi:hypothetical protein
MVDSRGNGLEEGRALLPVLFYKHAGLVIFLKLFIEVESKVRDASVLIYFNHTFRKLLEIAVQKVRPAACRRTRRKDVFFERKFQVSHDAFATYSRRARWICTGEGCPVCLAITNRAVELHFDTVT